MVLQKSKKKIEELLTKIPSNEFKIFFKKRRLKDIFCSWKLYDLLFIKETHFDSKLSIKLLRRVLSRIKGTSKFVPSNYQIYKFYNQFYLFEEICVSNGQLLLHCLIFDMNTLHHFILLKRTLSPQIKSIFKVILLELEVFYNMWKYFSHEQTHSETHCQNIQTITVMFILTVHKNHCSINLG